MPLLGRVPLDAALRESGDAGVPLVLSDPDCEPRRRRSCEIARAIDASRVGGFTKTLKLVSVVQPEDARPRLAALGFGPGRRRGARRALPVGRAHRHGSGTACRGSSGSRRWAVARPVTARPERVVSEPGLRALGRRRRTRLPDAVRGRQRPARRPAGARAGGRLLAHVPDGRPRLLGAHARGRWARGRAHGHVAAPAAASRRRAAAGGHEPAGDRRSRRRTAPGRLGRLDGRGHLRRRDRGACGAARSSCRSAAPSRTRRSRSRSASSCWSSR